MVLVQLSRVTFPTHDTCLYTFHGYVLFEEIIAL